jgi:hypothetical protein
MERQTEPQLVALCARQAPMVDELERLCPPATMLGVVAIARAGLACWDHTNIDDEPVADCDGTWMALTCIEWLAAGDAA